MSRHEGTFEFWPEVWALWLNRAFRTIKWTPDELREDIDVPWSSATEDEVNRLCGRRR